MNDIKSFEVTPEQLFSVVALQKPESIYMPITVDKGRAYLHVTFDQLESFLHWHPNIEKITYRYTDLGTLYIQKMESHK